MHTAMRLTSFFHLVAFVLVTIVAQTIYDTHDDTSTIDSDSDKLIDDVGLEPIPHGQLAAHNDGHHPPKRAAGTEPSNRKQGTADPLKKTSTIGTASHKLPSALVSQGWSSGYDLWPFVEDFSMAHKLDMASKGTSTREVSPDTLTKSNIPPTLTITEGSFNPFALPRSLFKIYNEDRFREAKSELLIGKSKARRTLANPQFGEMAVQSIMGAGLFDPTNAIFSAITGLDEAVVWRIIGSGMADPVPDVLLTVAGRNAAVIEVKTTTAMGDDEINEISKHLATYTMEERKDVVKKAKGSKGLQESKDDEGHDTGEGDGADEEKDMKIVEKGKKGADRLTNVMTLVDSSSLGAVRSKRRKTTKTMEQVNI